MTTIKNQLLRVPGACSSRLKPTTNVDFNLLKLLIEMVITEIFSGVSLPQFINQTTKAETRETKRKASEAIRKASVYNLNDDIKSSNHDHSGLQEYIEPFGTINTNITNELVNTSDGFFVIYNGKPKSINIDRAKIIKTIGLPEATFEEPVLIAA